MKKGNHKQFYSVRVSNRAKKVSLRFTSSQGLEVVIPNGFRLENVPEIVDRHRSWIEKVRRRLEADPSRPAEPFPPESIDLKAVGRVVEVRCTPNRNGSPRLLYSGGDRLDLSGDIEQEEGCRWLLQAWLKHEGRRLLPPMLDDLSASAGLAYQSVQVRLQKTRWGSCSRKGTISLNAKMLLLAPELARYVMLHELCHTIHPNHSGRFWALMARFEPKSRRLDRELNQAGSAIPSWVESG